MWLCFPNIFHPRLVESTHVEPADTEGQLQFRQACWWIQLGAEKDRGGAAFAGYIQNLKKQRARRLLSISNSRLINRWLSQAHTVQLYLKFPSEGCALKSGQVILNSLWYVRVPWAPGDDERRRSLTLWHLWNGRGGARCEIFFGSSSPFPQTPVEIPQ